MPDPIAPYLGTEPMNVTSIEHNTHVNNFDNTTGTPTTRSIVLNNTALYGAPGSKKAIVVFFSRTAITDLVNVNPAGFVEHPSVKGITITFGMEDGVFKLVARSSDREGLCPVSLQDRNYKGVDGMIPNSELTTIRNSFKSTGYAHLETAGQHPAISFNNLNLYDLLFDLSKGIPTPIGNTTVFHVVISNKFSVQCLALNGVRSAVVFKEGLPCPPECYTT